jgi:hypothetical protein
MKEYLETLSRKYAAFNYERRYDARSAGGRFPAQAGDFGYWRLLEMGGVSGFIEVKEVAHDYRLPNKNFDSNKIARLKAKFIAGADVLVLVLHTTIGKWRVAPFEIFTENPAAPSWDLRVVTELYDTVDEALADVQALV